ncbi:hypothetical protein GCM10027168_05570 [Streptomyces capparidis]
MATALPRRLGGLLLVLGATLALLLGGAHPAAAHAALTGSDPAEDAVVQTAPERVTLTFSEAVRLSGDAIQVLDPDARDVVDGEAGHAPGGDATAEVKLHSGLPNGTYVVAWHVVSADSHPISGAFSFSVGAPSDTAVDLDRLPSADGGSAERPYDLARYLAYGGFALLVGSAAFVLVCWPEGGARRPTQRLLLTGWATLLLSTLALMALRGPLEGRGGGGLGAALDLSVLQETLDTKPGAALAVRLLLLAGVGAYLAVLAGETGRDRHREVRLGLYGAGLLLGAGLASTWAVMEHASAGIQTGIAVPVDVVHLMAMGVWTGGLATLLTALYAPAGRPIGTAAVERFSALAFWSVVALVGTGLYQAWRQVGSLDALTSTDFGKLLLAKVAGVALLLGAAWYSRRWARGLRSAPAPAPSGAGSGAGAGPGGGAEGDRAEEDAAARDGGEEPGREAARAARSGNPARAAELARQRAAVAAARAKRERDADQGRLRLRRSVLVEVCVAVVVLTITTFLTTTEPGRTAEAAPAGGASGQAAAGPVTVELPYDTGGAGGKGTAEITLDPARSGTTNELHARLLDPAGKPVDAPELRVSLSLPAKDLGPLKVNVQRLSDGHWIADGVRLPLAGEWEVAVTVRTSDIDQVTEKKTIEIG